MTPERWKRIEALFDSAVRLPPDERAPFLEAACAGDPELYGKVMSLLAADESPPSLLGHPIISRSRTVSTEELDDAPEDAILGQQLGHYRVERLLGSGGMGQVYLALDTELRRPVAIKLLHERFTREPERVRRFKREAHAASALNHPCILHVYEVGSDEERHFIVTEFVEGETLRRRLSEKPLPLREALHVAVEVSKAIGAAHRAGIVHRDIKPENIMLRPDGYVKVLDFGIAKLLEDAREGAGESFAQTEAGTVVGTARYMSPEQARGLEVDARTDIWSLGVVLYEMLAGRVPFDGETGGDIIVSILEREPPPLDQFLERVPHKLQSIVGKALRKERAERYQTSGELTADLEGLLKVVESDGAAGARLRTTVDDERHAVEPERAAVTAVKAGSGSGRGIWLGLLLLALLMTGVLFGLYRLLAVKRGAEERGRAFQNMRVERLTATGKVTYAAISPDGKFLAYVNDDAGRQSLWVKQVKTGSTLQIVQPAPVQYRNLVFSPDGDYVYYGVHEKNRFAGTVYRVSPLGGVPVKWLEEVLGGALSFSPDGSRVAFGRSRPDVGRIALVIAGADGTAQREVVSRAAPEFYYGVIWSPDGKSLTCGVRSQGEGGFYSSIEKVEVETGAERPLSRLRWAEVIPLAWMPDGRSLLMTGSERPGSSQIWQLFVAEDRVERVTNDLSSYAHLTVTREGDALVAVQYEAISGLWTAAQQGNGWQAKPLTNGRSDGNAGAVWTPDGRLIYTSSQGSVTGLWLMNADGTGARQLTGGAASAIYPTVSPDGRRVAFESVSTDGTVISLMDVEGGAVKQLTASKADAYPQFTPDGKWVLYTSWASGRSLAMKVSVDGGQPVPLTDTASLAPVASPDGKRVAFWQLTEQGLGIAVIPAEGGRPEKVLSVGEVEAIEMDYPLLYWTPDGRALSFVETRGNLSNLRALPLDGGPARSLTNFDAQRIFYFAYSPDGKRLVISRGNISSDAVIISNLKS